MGLPWNKELSVKDQKQKGLHLYPEKEEGEIKKRTNPNKLYRYNAVLIEKLV